MNMATIVPHVAALLAIGLACGFYALMTRARVQRDAWKARYEAANRELMGFEARSRGVGGTGEHGGPVVRELGTMRPVVIGAIDTDTN